MKDKEHSLSLFHTKKRIIVNVCICISVQPMACIIKEFLPSYNVDIVTRVPFEETVIESGITGDSDHIGVSLIAGLNHWIMGLECGTGLFDWNMGLDCWTGILSTEIRLPCTPETDS